MLSPASSTAEPAPESHRTGGMKRHRSPHAREGWQRSGPANGGVWTHFTGAIVQHCGHATALWPYYGTLADGARPTMDLGGKKGVCVPKFKYLDECQSWIEEQS